MQGISDLVTMTGLINLDFADVKAVMQNAGTALMAVGEGRGDGRAVAAARAAITSPLLDVSIEGATGVLLNVSGGPDLTLAEVTEAAETIQAAVDPDANIFFGAVIHPREPGRACASRSSPPVSRTPRAVAPTASRRGRRQVPPPPPTCAREPEPRRASASPRRAASAEPRQRDVGAANARDRASPRAEMGARPPARRPTPVPPPAEGDDDCGRPAFLAPPADDSND